jgi:hypothetical protein
MAATGAESGLLQAVAGKLAHKLKCTRQKLDN